MTTFSAGHNCHCLPLNARIQEQGARFFRAVYDHTHLDRLLQLATVLATVSNCGLDADGYSLERIRCLMNQTA